MMKFKLSEIVFKDISGGIVPSNDAFASIPGTVNYLEMGKALAQLIYTGKITSQYVAWSDMASKLYNNIDIELTPKMSDELIIFITHCEFNIFGKKAIIEYIQELQKNDKDYKKHKKEENENI